jgi:hypothetical protein
MTKPQTRAHYQDLLAQQEKGFTRIDVEREIRRIKTMAACIYLPENIKMLENLCRLLAEERDQALGIKRQKNHLKLDPENFYPNDEQAEINVDNAERAKEFNRK